MIWLIVLFIFLLYRGIQACKERVVVAPRLFIIPILFLAIGIYQRWAHHLWFALGLMSCCTILGIITSMVFFAHSRYRFKRNPNDANTIIVPGSFFVLINAMSLYIINFICYTLLGYHMIGTFTCYTVTSIITGTLDGLFWGRNLYLLRNIEN